MARRYSLDPLADLVTGALEEDEEVRENPAIALNAQRKELLDKWSRDPWAFLTAHDPETNAPIIRTHDQRDKKHPIKAFPSHLRYIHYLVDVLEHEQYVQIEKASQMVVSTSILLWAAWRNAFRVAHKVLLSKHKEEEAATLIHEKIRTPWTLMPEWVRAAIPLTLRPQNKATWSKTHSIILGLPENAAAADARGQTYNVGLVDEAEFQDALAGILTAMLPRAGQVIFWSTPAESGEGARIFRSYLKNDPITLHPRLMELTKTYVDVKGMSLRRNEDKNITIVRIEHTADPSKRSQAWETDAAKPYPSKRDFEREMKISRENVAGRPFYPAFAEHRDRYVHLCKELIDAPIIRGWDAGKRNPACIWGQWSKQSRRFFVLRELHATDADMYVMRDVVKYLSGQLAYDSLLAHTTGSGANRAYELLEELSLNKAYPRPPWFQGHHAFVDMGGHEFVRGGPGLTKADEPQVAAEILALGDIYIMPPYSFKRSRYEIIRALSKIRVDGLPGIILDPACPTMIDGLCGGIVYGKATEAKPEPNEPTPNSYSHGHDALGYALVNTVALDHADYFAAPAVTGDLPETDLTVEQTIAIESYLTGEGL